MVETEVVTGMPDMTERRREVVRRLLDRGVSVPTLAALLPSWEPLIREAGTGH